MSDKKYTFSWRALSKEDSQVYKGIGIILIVFHNFFHLIPPIIGENEFSFSQSNCQRFTSAMLGSPLDSIHHLFSYFGHYGVQIFIFLSAYGLTRSYLKKEISFSRIVFPRLKRLYPSFCLVILVHIVAVSMFNNTGFSYLYLKGYLLKLLLIANFMPERALEINGPWWFFSFIIQFYLLFPFLCLLIRRYGLASLLYLSIFSFLLRLAVNPYLLPYKVNLLHTVFGYLPDFCLGIFFAQAKQIRLSFWQVFLVIIVFCLGNVFESFWHLNSLSITLLLLLILQGVSKYISAAAFTKKVLCYFGAVSLHLFLIHGFMRPPFLQLAKQHNSWLLNLALAVAFLALSTFIAQCLLSFEKLLRARLA